MKGKNDMKSVVIIECSIVHVLVFFYFPVHSLTNLDVFLSLKLFATPGESSLKISAH